jgi:hypothetical protein
LELDYVSIRRKENSSKIPCFDYMLHMADTRDGTTTRIASDPLSSIDLLPA